MEHQVGVTLFGHAAVGRHKAGDALLHLLKAAHGLRHPQNDAGMPHRVHGHGGCGHDEAAPGADGKRDTDGVPAAQHQRCAGLGYAGDQLCQRKARFHIPAHRVQQHQQALDAGVLLRGYQLRDDMLILCGLLALRRFRMAFDLADDGQAVDDMPAAGQRDRAQILDLFLFQPTCVGLLRFIVHMLSSCVFCQHSPACAGLYRPAAAKKR